MFPSQHFRGSLIPVLGELELTFTMTACRVANMEALMEDKRISTDAKELVDAFSTVVNEDHRGTRLADEHHFPPTKPPVHTQLDSQTFLLYSRLISATNDVSEAWRISTSRVLVLEKVTIAGIIYSSFKSLPRDSNIVFQVPGKTSHCIGRVDSIFQPECNGASNATFLVVSQFSVVREHPMQDVYKRFGFAGGYLYSEDYVTLRVIRTLDVICHFVRTPVDSEGQGLIHALPLNTVCSPMWNPFTFTCLTHF
jgi:hypothetical protein